MKYGLLHLLVGLGALLLGSTPAAAQGPVYNPANGHFYEAVATPGGLPWDQAKVQAEGMSHLGVQGHLATITDDAENTFVWTQVVSPDANQYWLGGYQDRNAPDYSEPDCGWRWVSGEPWNLTAWFTPGEPNNTGGFEDYVTFDHQVPNWNDAVVDYSWNAGFLVEYDTQSGVPYCFGDPGSGTPCPCVNDNDGSVPGSGCANGVFASGAKLTGSGTASVSADTLVLTTTHLEPNNSGLYFQANNDLSPGIAWGDGLQCAGGSLKRLQVRFADAAGTSSTTIGISAKAGNVSPGDTKRYQCWYRTTQDPPCGLGVFDFNASNGLEVVWAP